MEIKIRTFFRTLVKIPEEKEILYFIDWESFLVDKYFKSFLRRALRARKEGGSNPPSFYSSLFVKAKIVLGKKNPKIEIKCLFDTCITSFFAKLVVRTLDSNTVTIT